jgi:hypothetical protein
MQRVMGSQEARKHSHQTHLILLIKTHLKHVIKLLLLTNEQHFALKENG